jgi:formiminoglutamase
VAMGDDTLKYMRSDAAHSPFAKARRRDDPRLGGRMVALDGNPEPQKVQTVLIGVSDDRGVGLSGGRLGAVEGPQQFRDHFWRMNAPESLARGSILDAGDMVSAARTNETHARLTEVIDVLRDRFCEAKMVVVGGGHDHVYGEVLGVARWLRKQSGSRDIKLAHVSCDARANVHSVQGEPNASGPLKRLLLEPSAQLDGKSLVIWGLQRALTADKHMAFLRAHGVPIHSWEAIEEDPRRAAGQLVAKICSLALTHDAVTLSVDLGVFSQAVAPGVSSPSAVGVDAGAVIRAAAALGSLPCLTQLGIYELNPRFDRDGATARLAARIAWSYVTAQKDAARPD